MQSILFSVLTVSAIGLIAGILLCLASKYFAVPTDEKQEKIRECLPGANCGACGFSGCDGYAAALADGTAEPNLCSAGGAKTAAALSTLLGADVSADKKVARVFCNHGLTHANLDFLYSGANSCLAANLLYDGPLECKYGCIGFGDCVNACNFNAIKIEDSVAKVDKNLCVGCGKCAKVCPKSIITVTSAKESAAVLCSNKEKGAVSRKKCDISCLACTKCVKVCESGAITIKDNLAVIDTDKCTLCKKCIDACPNGCISAF